MDEAGPSNAIIKTGKIFNFNIKQIVKTGRVLIEKIFKVATCILKR